MELNFSANVQDATIYGINKFMKIFNDLDIEFSEPVAHVEFSVEPELRERGIKYMAIAIQKVTSDINWYVYEDELSKDDIYSLLKAGGVQMRGGTIEGTIRVDSTSKVYDKEWTLESELKFGEDGELMISDVEIDLENLVITVS